MRRSTGHYNLEESRCTLSVCRHLLGKGDTYISECLSEQLVSFGILVYLYIRLTVGKNDICVIGRSISIDGYHIEAVIHRLLYQLLKHILIYLCIGGRHGKHGSHIGMDHARSLGHTSDRNSLTIHLKGAGRSLRNGIGSHDGKCRSLVCISPSGKAGL